MGGDRTIGPAAPEGAAGVRAELHCFSGTGNTFRVASWIAERARARGAEVAVVRIPAGGGGERLPTSAPGRRLLGILTPTHGFTAPWPVLAYAATLPGVRGADVVVVVTRAGWYFGPVPLPGLEGTAAWLLALVLAARGGRLIGVRAVDMPSNWTALHWGLSDGHVAAVLGKAQLRASTFADRILDGRPQLTGWLSLACGLLLAPVSLGYVVLARRLLGKLFFADERCTSCGLCARHCPFDAVRMTGASPARPFWTFECESCMRCMNICPERSIQANWFGAAAESYVMLVVFEAIVGASGTSSGPLVSLAASVAACIVLFVLTAPAYRVAWTLGRAHAAGWLLGHLTPTRVFRRYSEPGTDLRDI